MLMTLLILMGLQTLLLFWIGFSSESILNNLNLMLEKVNLVHGSVSYLAKDKLGQKIKE